MPPEGSGGTRGPVVLTLTDRRATDPATSGSKAANLARAAAADLPIVPGFVLTTEAAGVDENLEAPGLRDAWEGLTEGGRRPVVVRSSSTVEDAQSSSMAGQFDSVLGVQGWDDFTAAVRQVLASAASPAAQAGGRAVAPMAVLVQREVAPSVSGVLFGVDPVTGDGRHLVTDVVAGSPYPLVSGEVGGERYVLSHAGRIASTTDSSRSLLPASRGGRWPGWATRPRRSLAAPRTSSGRSTATTSSACSSRGRSRWSGTGGPEGPSSDRGRSRDVSPAAAAPRGRPVGGAASQRHRRRPADGRRGVGTPPGRVTRGGRGGRVGGGGPGPARRGPDQPPDPAGARSPGTVPSAHRGVESGQAARRPAGAGRRGHPPGGRPPSGRAASAGAVRRPAGGAAAQRRGRTGRPSLPRGGGGNAGSVGRERHHRGGGGPRHAGPGPSGPLRAGIIGAGGGAE